ncbi:hypothetical protein Z945_3489 [Sulfitobacter noctilucae]|nr:hypothetical protein Z945_3489 [Sulfitobacter noctilucae]
MLIGAVLTGDAAHAHAADQGFVLLLPTTAYITGGTIAVAVTILLMFFLNTHQLARAFTPYDTGLPGRWFTPPRGFSLLASAALAALIYIGLAGPTDPQANLLPLTLWTVWWMALFVVQGVVCDVWRWINPWTGVFDTVFPDHKAPLVLPKSLSVWPAVLLFAAFMGFVLADTAPNDPERLATFALGYWLFTLTGMALFGRKAWLRQVECFTVLFGLIGNMRIAGGDRTLKLGVPGWQTFHGTRFDLSHAFFVLVLLAAGSFDGLHETFWWLGQLGINPLEYPGRTAMVQITTLGLIGAICLLTAVFAGAVWIGLRAVPVVDGQRAAGFAEAFIRFAIALLPIAIGYHFAHYFVTFLVQMQVVVATLADPLAKGWNLFGLAQSRVMVGFLTVPQTVKLIWLTQAGIVVLAHILSVILTHKTAETLCRTRADVLKMQLGLSFLMVAYTVFGLWLLASPRGV